MHVGPLALAAVTLAAPPADGERAAVEAVVRDAYVGGVHVNRDAAAMRRGFHPDFRMLMLRDGALQAVTLDEWCERVERGARENPDAKPDVRAEFTSVDVVGSAASVRVEIHRDGRHTYSDYLSLYRFPDGWKIVSKTFYTHPQD